MTPFEKPLRPEDVGELIDLTVENEFDTQVMAEMQLEGVAALYNILCKGPFAYLADEVGMGKTYQALALAALVWNEKPNARLLFISPRQNLQEEWFGKYQQFFSSNYRRKQRRGDDRVASVLFREPVHRPMVFHDLRSWTRTIGMPERIAPFLRHTSFTRPVYVTSRDLGDMNALWHDTQRQLRKCGLFEVSRPRGLSPENASSELNLAFARAVHARLTSEAGGEPYFDLVVVDEAQCLRNPGNQTNQVIFEAFRGHVRKWLFMSATPAHGGPGDIPTILNRYPHAGEVLAPGLAENLPAMQEALQAFMVRRPRLYRVKAAPAMVGKEVYRKHDSQSWGVRDADMTALGTLAMGLVQKGLVEVLQGRSNRYRIGFLSSFESLQSSIERTLPPPTPGDDTAEDETSGDWHRGQADGSNEPEAPDTGFIHRLSRDFEERFGLPLPHPKVDSVVDRVAPLAFGTDDEPGGHKFLIFTRRVSTVSALRKRLNLRYLQAIEARIRRCWGEERFDWTGRSARVEEAGDTDDPEAFDHAAEENPFREAMSRKGWLFRYRQKFRTSGRNALFFEDGWLQRLCAAGGVAPAEAARALPDELWAESWAHASHAAGGRRRQHRADRVRYLAVHTLQRAPRVFGLDERSAAPWRSAYEAALWAHLERADTDAGADPHRDPELFTQPTLWTCWDARFPVGPLALPAADPRTVAPENGRDELCRRQVARTLLGQTFRLTDTLLDLYYADLQAQTPGLTFAERFLAWLSSDDPGARQTRRDCEHWLVHLRLIVDGCLDGASRPWHVLAREESWLQLFNPMAVMGVTGGSGAHKTATRQFRTPSLPRVIVCTDTLKEGVDLHLFCDRVLHYGVAWTSGDLEQRVGRVDRYFSQIERRLNTEGPPPAAELHVGYPHVVASLERGQVERVIERQRRAEELMDSPLAGTRDEEKDLVVGASAPRSGERLAPYRPHSFPAQGRDVVVVSANDAQASAEHYVRWHRELLRALRERGWNIVAFGDEEPARQATLAGKDRQHEFEWSFDAALSRYVLTLSSSPWPTDATFRGGARRRLVERARRVETFMQILVPTPEEGRDTTVIACLGDALAGIAPRVCSDARPFWGEALASVASGGVDWMSDHTARVVVARGERAHAINLSAYEGGVRVVGVVACLDEVELRGASEGPLSAQGVRDWLLDETRDLPLGYLDVHEHDHLVFGIHVLHGELSKYARRRLLEEVAWRADVWEAALTGVDRW
jgi:hypothetical protein